MEWFRAHPYVLTLVGAGILILVGAIVVENRSPVAPDNSTITWSGGVPVSSYQNGTTYGQTPTPQQIVQEVVQGQGAVNVTLPTLATSSAPSAPSPSGPFDYMTLLAQLSAQASTKPMSSSAQGQVAINAAYQFIPQGLVANAAPTTKPRTSEQQALYEYGNQVGGEIQSFEELHTNETQVIKDQAEDRTDPTKAAAVVSLGLALASVGTSMQEMQNVPTSVQSLHTALAQSYSQIGAKLQLVPSAQTDPAFVQAVKNYDSAANTFVQNYGALAQYFSAQGVVFSQQDPGSVFSFNQSGGL